MGGPLQLIGALLAIASAGVSVVGVPQAFARNLNVTPGYNPVPYLGAPPPNPTPAPALRPTVPPYMAPNLAGQQTPPSLQLLPDTFYLSNPTPVVTPPYAAPVVPPKPVATVVPKARLNPSGKYASPKNEAEAVDAVNKGHVQEFFNDRLMNSLPYASVGMNLIGSGLVLMPYIEKVNQRLPGGGFTMPQAVKEKMAVLRELAAKSGNKFIVKAVRMSAPELGGFFWAAAMVPRAALAFQIGAQENQASIIVSNAAQLVLSPILLMLNRKKAAGLVDILAAGMFVVGQAEIFAKEAGEPHREYDMTKLKGVFDPKTGASLGERMSDLGHESVGLLKQTAGDHVAMMKRLGNSLTKTKPLDPSYQPAAHNPVAKQIQKAWVTHDGWKELLDLSNQKGDPARTNISTILLYTGGLASAAGATGPMVTATNFIGGLMSDFGIARIGSKEIQKGHVAEGGTGVAGWVLESIGSGLTAGLDEKSTYAAFGPLTARTGKAMAQAYYAMREANLAKGEPGGSAEALQATSGQQPQQIVPQAQPTAPLVRPASTIPLVRPAQLQCAMPPIQQLMSTSSPPRRPLGALGDSGAREGL